MMTQKNVNRFSVIVGIFGVLFTVLQAVIPETILQIIIALSIIVLLAIVFFILRRIYDKVIESFTNTLRHQILDSKVFCMEGKRFYERDCLVIRRNTLQFILDYLIEQSKDDSSKTLEGLGKTIADYLINDYDLEKKLKKKIEDNSGNATPSPKEVIRQWCSVEENCHWGKFDITFTDLGNNGKFRGTVTIKNNVLAKGRNSENKQLCLYFVSYFKHIISKLAGFPVCVEEKNCGTKFGDGECTFSFTPTESTI